MHPPLLYETVLGARYAELAPAVQTFYCLIGAVTLHGRAETEPPATHLVRVLAWCIRMPRVPTRDPIRITLNTAGTEEIWTRQFPRHTMRSTLSLHRGYLTGRLGAVRLFFLLEVNHAVLRMRLEGLRFLGVPYPAWLRPAMLAEGSGDGDHLRFNVHASLPLLDVVAVYRGYLDLTTMERE